MNFYIGNSVEDIAVTDRNAAFSDELQNYLYKLRKRVDCDMDILFNIDPSGIQKRMGCVRTGV